jgi:hypothetical protein
MVSEAMAKRLAIEKAMIKKNQQELEKNIKVEISKRQESADAPLTTEEIEEIKEGEIRDHEAQYSYSVKLKKEL